MEETNIPSWDKRPQIIANQLNPAFCAAIIQTAIRYYSEETKRSMPFTLLFLVLPIVIHKPTREKMPRSIKKHLYAWIEENPELKIDFDKRVKGLIPFTKEAIAFLLNRQLIEIDSNGGIVAKKYGNRKIVAKSELEDIIKKAKLFGRQLAKSGTVTSTYSIFGLKP